MSPRIKISDIIDIIGVQSNNTTYYLDKESGQLFPVSNEQLRTVHKDGELEDYPEWEREQVELVRKILSDEKDERYILIPVKFVSHEYSAMENFSFSIDDDEISRALLRAIKGAGAFNRFNNCIHRYRVADDWFKYRYNSMKKIVIDWCEENNIEYVEK